MNTETISKHTPDFIHGSHNVTSDHSIFFAQVVCESKGFSLLRAWSRRCPSAPMFVVRTPSGFLHEFPTRRLALDVYPAIAKAEGR